MAADTIFPTGRKLTSISARARTWQTKKRVACGRDEENKESLRDGAMEIE